MNEMDGRGRDAPAGRLYTELERLRARPVAWSAYTVAMLWDDPHVSAGMLQAHLNPETDAASYRASFRERAISWLAETFGIGPGTKVADFGCGPGLYTMRFAEMGAAVTGIDLSGRSLAYGQAQAEAAGLQIEYVRQNYLDYASAKRFDLITLISRDFAVLNPKQRRELLAVFKAHLAEGGAIVMDIDSLHHFAGFDTGQRYHFAAEGGFWSSQPHHAFMHRFKYEAEALLLEKHTIIEAKRTREIYNWYQCYAPAALTSLFTENGLMIDGWYGDVAGQPFDEMAPSYAIVARAAPG